MIELKGQLTIFFLIAIALILGAAGCASSAAPKPLPTPGTATSAFPTGTFLWQGEDPFGGHQVEYRSDGSYVYQGHGRAARGKYTLTGDQVLFLDNHCGGVKGIYKWTFDRSTLAFELLDDTCADRLGVLAHSEWKVRDFR